MIVALALVLASPLAAQKEVTDDSIHDQVRMKLVSDTVVQGGAITVDVENGAVTLKGRVRTGKAKAKAEKLAKGVKGVKSVNNQLTVSPTFE
ncbi:MAG: BON domain-containing protein [Acidobacteriia bacterium]|nr:BON domain-containing protein [Terriglobia bacterium]